MLLDRRLLEELVGGFMEAGRYTGRFIQSAFSVRSSSLPAQVSREGVNRAVDWNHRLTPRGASQARDGSTIVVEERGPLEEVRGGPTGHPGIDQRLRGVLDSPGQRSDHFHADMVRGRECRLVRQA